MLCSCSGLQIWKHQEPNVGCSIDMNSKESMSDIPRDSFLKRDSHMSQWNMIVSAIHIYIMYDICMDCISIYVYVYIYICKIMVVH